MPDAKIRKDLVKADPEDITNNVSKPEVNMSRNPPGIGMPVRTDEPGIMDDTRVIYSEEAENLEQRSRPVQ